MNVSTTRGAKSIMAAAILLLFVTNVLLIENATMAGLVCIELGFVIVCLLSVAPAFRRPAAGQPTVNETPKTV